MMNRRNSEEAQRFAERRRREDEAPRLLAVSPTLESLRLEVEERLSGRLVSEGTHVRRIVVALAPALFVLPCGDSSCKDGGHDLTFSILHALRARETRFEGEDACAGQTGSSPCQRVLKYVGIAEYKT